MNNVTDLFPCFANQRFGGCSRNWKEADEMFWRGQNGDFVNALIVSIRSFINRGVPVSGIRIMLAHLAILSRN
jgi:hypothetical protein